MKVLLYFEDLSLIRNSGIGKAYEHQKLALESQSVEVTCDLFANYDILHINTYGICSDAVIHHALRQGKKVIYHAHSTEEDFRGSFIFSDAAAPLYRRRLISLYAKADALITPTPYAASLLKGYGLHNPVYTVSNGVETGRFSESAAKRMLFRKTYGLRMDERVVISAGLPFLRKGIDDFFAAARRLPEYRFIWFGHLNPLLLTPSVRRLMKDLPANMIMPGYVKGDLLEGAFLDADCFFFPSREETEGIAVLEALAAGQNVVVRDIPVYEGWLEDGVSCRKGWDIEDFVRLIRETAEGKDEKMAQNARRIACERSIEKTGRRLKDVYERVLAGC